MAFTCTYGIQTMGGGRAEDGQMNNKQGGKKKIPIVVSRTAGSCMGAV